MHLNASVGYIYRLIVTKAGMRVFLGGMYSMPQSFSEILIVFDF